MNIESFLRSIIVRYTLLERRGRNDTGNVLVVPCVRPAVALMTATIRYLFGIFLVNRMDSIAILRADVLALLFTV